MTLASPTLPRSRIALPLRFALRDLRGGLRGFYVFIACIALGVMAIAGVNSFASSLADGLAREGRAILGGDLAFTLSQREANAAERRFLDEAGRVSVVATMRAMVRTDDGRSTLVEMKAVDTAYPLHGAVMLDPAGPLAGALAQRDGVYGAVAETALLARLELKPGARISIGSVTFELRAALMVEPDKLASGIGFGPRLMIAGEALHATGLIQPGSLVRWHYRLRLPDNDATDAAVTRVTDAAAARLPDAGWEMRSRNNASPALERNIERFTQYLTLVGLTALLVGGVGVANAIRGHLDRKRDTIATMKALGATGGGVFAIYLTQAMALALIGALPGLALGAALPFLIAKVFGAVLPLPIAPALHLDDLALALLYGLLTALAFALWPLGRAHDISVSALFRDEVAPERRRPRTIYVTATVLTVSALAVLAVKLAYDQRIAAIFVIAAAGVFVSLRLVASAVMAIARRVPRPRATALRLALANIHRPGALTTSIVLSLGLGLALLVTVLEVDGNLRRQFMAALPERAPSFYFLDIQSADAERFDAFIREHAPGATLGTRPDVARENRGGERRTRRRPEGAAEPVLGAARRPRHHLLRQHPAGLAGGGGRVVDAGLRGPPLVSFERRVASALGLKVGDPVTVNVLGRNIDARVANLRTLDWQSLGINFAMVFSPASSARRAAHAHCHAHLARRQHRRAGDRAAEGRRRGVSLGCDGAGARGDRRLWQRGGQPRAGDPRRERAHAPDRGAGARRRAGGRPPAPGLRRCRAQDAGRHPGPAHARLCARIPDAGRRHRRLRRDHRYGGRCTGHHHGDEPAVRLVARPRPRRCALCGGGDRGAGPPRHLPCTRPKTRAGAAQPLTIGVRWDEFYVICHIALRALLIG